MFAEKIDKNWQITIPNGLRDFLHVKPGDNLGFFIETDGRVRVRPVQGSFRDLDGLLHDPKQKTVSVEEMDVAIRDRYRDFK